MVSKTNLSTFSPTRRDRWQLASDSNELIGLISAASTLFYFLLKSASVVFTQNSNVAKSGGGESHFGLSHPTHNPHKGNTWDLLPCNNKHSVLYGLKDRRPKNSKTKSS